MFSQKKHISGSICNTFQRNRSTRGFKELLKHWHSACPLKHQILTKNGSGGQIRAQKTLSQADNQWQTFGFIKFKVLRPGETMKNISQTLRNCFWKQCLSGFATLVVFMFWKHLGDQMLAYVFEPVQKHFNVCKHVRFVSPLFLLFPGGETMFWSSENIPRRDFRTKTNTPQCIWNQYHHTY